MGKQVKIAGQGLTKVGKDKAGAETKTLMLKKITTIEIVLAQ